jgi:predicted alpha/beta hydrolase family esterase
MEKKFKTLQEIFDDEKVNQLLDNQISKYRDARKLGARYKRTAYDTLSELGHFNAAYFIEQFPAIVLKQSSLSSSVRQLIENIMNESIRLTYQHYKLNRI